MDDQSGTHKVVPDCLDAELTPFAKLTGCVLDRTNHSTLVGMPFDRITIDQKVMAGVPCIRGTRIPVATVVGMVAEGMSAAQIRVDFPQLVEDDIRQALLFAAAAVDQATLPLPATA